MKIAIIGYGVEGQAAYRYYQGQGEITICDQSTTVQAPTGVQTQLGDDYLANLERFDVIVRSPFVRPDMLLEHGATIEKVTSCTNEFLRVCPSKHIIGITGTKGKGTTSTLTRNMLASAGKTVHLGGNIGVAALDMLAEDIQPDDWVVLELSSFQLIDIQRSPPIAVCLMMVPEHLNWHADFAEYLTAKQQLFRWQTDSDVAVYYAANSDSRRVASAGSGQKIPYMQPPGASVIDGNIVIDGQVICATSELQLLGAHNWQNVCAAVTAVWQVTQDVTALRLALTTFSGLEHRLELVRERSGVRYYNDSFGTTPETATVALQAFDAPKVIILGGSDKGARYDELARTVAASNMRQALLIGDQAKPIAAALDAAGFHNYANGGGTMSEIVTAAAEAAHDGDVVLLSTSCASFDMFKDYKDRGNQFKAAVQALV